MTARAALALLLALPAAACDLSMSEQPKLNTYTPTSIFPDGTSARPLPPGAVAQNARERDAIAANPPPATDALLARGRERFDIFCSPCHGIDGHGGGVVVQRGFPRPPDFHSPEILNLPANRIVDAINNGYGVMYSYASRVPPADRWAIVAYIRALQLSQHAQLADYPQAKERLPP